MFRISFSLFVLIKKAALRPPFSFLSSSSYFPFFFSLFPSSFFPSHLIQKIRDLPSACDHVIEHLDGEEESPGVVEEAAPPPAFGVFVAGYYNHTEKTVKSKRGVRVPDEFTVCMYNSPSAWRRSVSSGN